MSWIGSIFGVGGGTNESPRVQEEQVDVSTPSTSHPRVIKVGVLLDGDADYFTSAYTLKGYRGGRSAALDLRNKLHYHYSNSHSQSNSTVEIITLSFSNLSGLNSYLGSGIDLRSFSQGFNSSPFAFSMIDVGSNKQAADEAIKSHLPFLLSTCDKILLGGTHDGGYSQTLLRLDPEILKEKICLLRTTSFCCESLLELGLEEIRFEGLFEGKDPTDRSANHRREGGITKSPSKSHRSTTTTTTVSGSGSGSKQLFTSSPAPFQNLINQLNPTCSSSSSNPIISPSISSVSSFDSSTTNNNTPPSTSLSSVPVDFTPLIETLKFYHDSLSIPQPHSKVIEKSIKNRYPNALSSLLSKVNHDNNDRVVEFFEFVKEAERRGLIKVNKLKNTIELIRGSLSSTIKATTSNSVGEINNSNEPDFLPLISILLNYATSSPPIQRPLRAIIGEKLSKSSSPSLPFEPLPGNFRRYYEKALEKGLVKIGRGEIVGTEWIELNISLEKAKKMLAVAAVREKKSGNADTTSTVTRQQQPQQPTSNNSGVEGGGGGDISRYVPLLEILVSLLPSTTQPEWTPIAGYVATFQPRPYSPKEAGSFKRYVQGANELGLIEIGKVKGKEFNFWMRLKGNEKQVVELIRKEKLKEGGVKYKSSKFPGMILPTQNQPQSTPRPPLSQAKHSITLPIDPKFYPLIRTLQQSLPHQPILDWTTVGSILSTVKPRPYELQEGSLKRYLEQAKNAGIVETGKTEGKEHAFWIRLNKSLHDYKLEETSSSSISHNRIVVPTRFQPLVKVISESPFDQPYCSQIASILSKSTTTRPFEVGGWSDYLRDAVSQGIVRTGVKGQGQEWVELREGISFSAISRPTLVEQTVSASSSTESKPFRPSPSTVVSSSTSSSTPNSSNVAIPPALLQHWENLYDAHPFSHLILVLNFIETSTSLSSSSSSSSSSTSMIPFSLVESYLEVLPGGIKNVYEKSTGVILYVDDWGPIPSDVLLRNYLSNAAARDVVEIDKELGVRLGLKFKGWKGR